MTARSRFHALLGSGRAFADRQFGRLTLSQRFLLVAVVVIALAMAGLGHLVGQSLRAGITEGVATTAAHAVESMIAHQLVGLAPGAALSADDRAKLEWIAEVGGDSGATRLLQLRLYAPAGGLLFESANLPTPAHDTAQIARAASGQQVDAALTQLVLAPVGPVAALPLDTLRILAPIHRLGTRQVMAVAEIYYGAGALQGAVRRAQTRVWIVVAAIGIAVALALYLVVAAASRTIASQRGRLAANLAASHRLSAENRELHRASEGLRITANLANENLLAFVGSEIHDGPIQLLTLIILRLTGARQGAAHARPTRGADIDATVALATLAIDELRSISTGLVLPELEELPLAEVIAAAITRHHALTGVVVEAEIGALPASVAVEIKICVYRIVQEALNNAFRHGEPEGQRVSARAVDGVLAVDITNQVRGPARGLLGDSRLEKLGLRGMRFRAEAVGGTLEVDLSALPAARISTRIPYASLGGKLSGAPIPSAS